MRLPILNRDYTPTGDTMDADEYFNPARNNIWLVADADRDPDTGQGNISVSTMTKIANAVYATFSKDDTLLAAAHRWGGNGPGAIYSEMASIFYDALPDHCKYLAFMTTFSGVGRGTPGQHKFRAVTYFPQNISFYECIRTHVVTEIIVNYDANVIGAAVTITEDQKQRIISNTLAAAAVAHEAFNSRMGNRVYNADAIVPRVVRLIHMYMNNAACFYPASETRGPLLGREWHTPETIFNAISAGANIGLTFALERETIGYRERPNVNDRSAISRVLSYSTNILDYLPFTIKGPKEPKATLYGIELEANADYSPAQVIEAQKDLFFCLKQDSSIRGSKRNNYEMVTVPCSLRAHKRLWAEFFTKIDYKQFDTSKDTGNGMHVHIDRKAFKSDNHLNRFTWFFINPAHADFLFVVSERATRNDLERWAPFPLVSTTKSLISQARIAKSLNGELRGAVHFKGSKTVEVRIFKGIVSYATISKNLEFVDSVVEYTREVSLMQLTLSGYHRWLESTPKNKYTMLKAFLAEVQNTNYFLSAQLDQYIWGAKNDEEIADRLNKAPFKITSHHISVLNKRRRKRTFTLKRGKVHLEYKNTGLLAKLDLIAQQKQTRGAATFSVSNL